MEGFIKVHALSILVDPTNTHDFLQEHVAKQLKLYVLSASLPVKILDDWKWETSAYKKKEQLRYIGELFSVTILVKLVRLWGEGKRMQGSRVCISVYMLPNDILKVPWGVFIGE